MTHQQTLTSYIAAFVAELVKTGVQDVVVSPGSRSTPMALVMAEHPGLKVHIHVDERSAAFFALGMAKASGKPAALLCTSGTAAANYYPAIIEAFYSRVPLLVLTADRPHELRDVGAPQAIDQIHLYGKHVKWFSEMALPEDTPEMIRYARTVCARAVSEASISPAGPVHLNFPFREPLIPNLADEQLFSFSERENGYVAIKQGERVLGDEQIAQLLELVNLYQNGLIVCGQMNDDSFSEAVTNLAEVQKYPILADPLSQLRSGEHDQSHIIDTYDTFLRSEEIKKGLKPELIIRFGPLPVSKSLSIFLKENHDVPQLVIDGGGGWRDPAALSSMMISCNETDFCKAMADNLTPIEDDSFLEKWKGCNKVTKESLLSIRDVAEMSEGKLFLQLTDLIPNGSTLFVSNSMPIRDLDTFFHNNDKAITIMANRGVNGIDGIISTALGAGLYSQKMYLVVGDLTFFHDLNGLIASKIHSIDLTVILINNNGGGIFSFLPQAEHPTHFELLFGTPLGIDFRHAVEMYGGKFDSVSTWNQFSSVFTEAEGRPGLNVIEIVTNRDSNLKEHRELWKSVSREISGLFNGDIR